MRSDEAALCRRKASSVKGNAVGLLWLHSVIHAITDTALEIAFWVVDVLGSRVSCVVVVTGLMNPTSGSCNWVHRFNVYLVAYGPTVKA